jgi:hypothetical protein
MILGVAVGGLVSDKIDNTIFRHIGIISHNRNKGVLFSTHSMLMAYFLLVLGTSRCVSLS